MCGHTEQVIWLAWLLFVPAAALMVLTALGARTRGTGGPRAVMYGLAFPLTWVLWYVQDEIPQRRS